MQTLEALLDAVRAAASADPLLFILVAGSAGITALVWIGLVVGDSRD